MLLATLSLLACSRSRPPAAISPIAAVEPSVGVAAPPPHVDGIPRVIRRILAEEHALVERSAELAQALPDPTGRARAVGEVAALEAELGAIDAPLQDADSARLDVLVTKLVALDTRIALLHESLARSAQSRAAVAID